MKMFPGDTVRVLKGARKESIEVVDRLVEDMIVLRGIPDERFQESDLQMIQKKI